DLKSVRAGMHNRRAWTTTFGKIGQLLWMSRHVLGYRDSRCFTLVHFHHTELIKGRRLSGTAFRSRERRHNGHVRFRTPTLLKIDSWSSSWHPRHQTYLW